MTFLRNIGHDLIEKRLWPLALLLVAALIAAPIVLAREPAATDTSTATPNVGGAARDIASTVAVAADRPERARLRLRDPRNPFREPGRSSGSSKSKGGAGTSVAVGTSTTSSTGGGTQTTTTPPTTTEPPPSTGTLTWTLDGVFGPLEDMQPLSAVPLGTGIPSNDGPVLVFAGVSDDGKEAIFLPSSDAKPLEEGDGRCAPNWGDACLQLTLRVGETAILEVSTATGIQQYVLELDGLKRRNIEDTVAGNSTATGAAGVTAGASSRSLRSRCSAAAKIAKRSRGTLAAWACASSQPGNRTGRG
jgi:hypothetical protein